MYFRSDSTEFPLAAQDRNFRCAAAGTSGRPEFPPLLGRNFRCEPEPKLLLSSHCYVFFCRRTRVLIYACPSIYASFAGSSHSRMRTKRAASRTPRSNPRPQDIEFDSESDQETLASRRAQIDRQRKKKKAVQVTISDMTRNEFIQWRKTDFYAEPRDLEIDNCFWCHE